MLTDNMKGAAFMSASMAGFAFNDAFIKLAATEASIYQAIFIRGCFATLLIGAFAWYHGAFRTRLERRDAKLIAWRSLWEALATVCFLTALVHMPLANVTAILQALPLTVTLAAAVFLGEAFGWRRGLAILVGFLGVLLIVQPGATGFNIYAVLALAAVICVTARDLIVRKLSSSVPSLLVAFITAVVITCAGGAISLVQGNWIPIDWTEIRLLAYAALFIFGGYFYSVAAMRVGEVASVTPFRYTIMIWAILLGWWNWGDVPDPLTWVGILIVVAAGLFTIWRERAA